jgi:predicted small lipoprotein YifL
MKKHLNALTGICVALLLVTGCGKKGPLEAPGSATEAPLEAETAQPLDNPSVTPQWPGAATSPASGTSSAY